MNFLHRIAAASLPVLSAMAMANAASVDTLISACHKDKPAEFSQCLRKHADVARADVKASEKAVRAWIATGIQGREYLPTQKSAFEASVESFRKYRQHECAFVASLAAGGTAASDLQYACYAELDAIRAGQLRARISVPGDDSE